MHDDAPIPQIAHTYRTTEQHIHQLIDDGKLISDHPGTIRAINLPNLLGNPWHIDNHRRGHKRTPTQQLQYEVQLLHAFTRKGHDVATARQLIGTELGISQATVNRHFTQARREGLLHDHRTAHSTTTHLTVTDTAQHLNTTEEHIRKHIRSGRLAATKTAHGYWMIDRTSAQTLKTLLDKEPHT